MMKRRWHGLRQYCLRPRILLINWMVELAWTAPSVALARTAKESWWMTPLTLEGSTTISICRRLFHLERSHAWKMVASSNRLFSVFHKLISSQISLTVSSSSQRRLRSRRWLPWTTWIHHRGRRSCRLSFRMPTSCSLKMTCTTRICTFSARKQLHFQLMVRTFKMPQHLASETRRTAPRPTASAREAKRRHQAPSRFKHPLMKLMEPTTVKKERAQPSWSHSLRGTPSSVTS